MYCLVFSSSLASWPIIDGMDVSCKRWHSRAQTKLVPGRVESALVHFWTQCEGSKHCNKWILILTTPLRLNAILRNLKLKLFLEKRCKCVSASTTSVHVARAKWVDYSERCPKRPTGPISEAAPSQTWAIRRPCCRPMEEHDGMCDAICDQISLHDSMVHNPSA